MNATPHNESAWWRRHSLLVIVLSLAILAAFGMWAEYGLNLGSKLDEKWFHYDIPPASSTVTDDDRDAASNRMGFALAWSGMSAIEKQQVCALFESDPQLSLDLIKRGWDRSGGEFPAAMFRSELSEKCR